jgi:LacI family transcriptional regulator
MPRIVKPRRRHVAVFVESSTGVGRTMLAGVAKYQSEQDSWILYFEPHGMEAGPPRWLGDWHGDGIIARVTTPRMASALRATGLPVIDLLAAVPCEDFLCVLADNHRIGELAFDHLRSRGIEQFAFCGVPYGQHHNQDERCEAFRRHVEAAGFPCHLFRSWEPGANLERTQEHVAAWLRRLPRPVGVLACHDDCGFQVLTACRYADLRVPQEVAVIGVDNDPVLCNLSNPRMTSIDVNGQRRGYEAAAWLERLMQGQKPPPGPIVIEPRGLVAGRSTDVLAFADEAVTAAVRFIREHACEGIRVTDILAETSLSQKTLERRFHQYLGRSPKAELMRVQIERAQQLLRETTLPLKTIAHHSGFTSEQYFSDAFFRHCGIRPDAYRKRCAPDGSSPLSPDNGGENRSPVR